MIPTLRCLAVCGLLILLTGCVDRPCGLPGEFSEEPAVSCYYQLKINHVDMEKKLVTAQLPKVFKVKLENPPPGGPYYRILKLNKTCSFYIFCKDYENTAQYTFRVRYFEQVAGQIQKNSVHEFNRQGDGVYFELIPNAPRDDDDDSPQPKK